MVHPWRAAAPTVALALLVGAGCEDTTKKNAGNAGVCDDVDGLQTCYNTGKTGGDGILTIDVNVNSGAGAFLISATTGSGAYLSVEEITAPGGGTDLYWEDWYYGDNNLTAGILPLYNEMQINWPVRDADPALTSGVYSVKVAAINEGGRYLSGQNIEYYTQVKQDTSFSSGTVHARIVYVDGLDSDTNITAATESAVEVWRTIWTAYGLSLSVDYDTDPGVSADLPSMTEGGADIDRISEAGTDFDITVVVGDTVGGTTQIYGESGGIPGTLVDGDHSAVAISWITNAGGDGTFSDDDIRVYGETLAHEVGHYMGLFHPVDFDGNSPLYWDALDDTDECTRARDCESALGENNMYPFPVCPDFNSCVDQQTLSDDQTGVLHRHVGAL
jgi:hypothetical protein